jgi:catechol 2,3-dioxygenase-like lactoylglutathione lyase family enzyme
MTVISGIKYVRYAAPDLDLMQRFLEDFGLVLSERTDTELRMRGAGDEPFLHLTELAAVDSSIGIGLQAQSLESLHAIAEAAGVGVEDVPNGDGEQIARLVDPNGLKVDVLHGGRKVAPLQVREPLMLNDARTNARRGAFQRPQRGPSHVVRLEHAVLAGPNMEEALAFYQNILGMKVSDTITAGDGGDPAAVFLHCGLGDEYTDHHTVAIARNDSAAIDHAGFVTLDWDDLMLGHQHLKAAGHVHDWGIGRHIMGSEVFDYWRDPFGNKVEHCFDGDLVNDDHEPQTVSIEEDILSVWSPPLSETFGKLNTRR